MAVLGELQLRVRRERLHLVGAKLVVHEAGKGERVAEELLACDGVVEDEHRGKDEKDIFEDAGHGEDYGRGLTNLWDPLEEGNCI